MGSPLTEQVKRRDDEPGDAEHAPCQPASAARIWVGSRVSRFAISVRTSAISVRCSARISAKPALNWSERDVLALLDDQPERVREGVRLSGREVGSSQ